MTFMNKKEEVIDIELTPYGKYLLAKGKMKPVYYAFFDDNILYDAEYFGITELQSEAKDRIRKETPQLKTQYKFTSEANQLLEIDFGTKDTIIPEAPASRDSLSYPLSTAQIGSNKLPAITLSMYRGNISSYDLEYRTKVGNKKIDQLNAEIVFKKDKKIIEFDEDGLPMDTVGDLPDGDELYTKFIEGPVDATGKYYEIQTDYLLADIFESNVDFDFENFDIEVFRVDTVTVPSTSSFFGIGTEEKLVPLEFKTKPKNNIVNNILIETDEDEDLEEIQDLAPSNVEYYFNIYCDSEIDMDVIMESVTELKSKGFFTDHGYDITKAPQVIRAVADIYGTNVTENDIEDCG